MAEKKPIIGICGGIGAGKTEVARAMRLLGGLVIDSDAINREILSRPEIIRTFHQWWGDDVISPDGGVNRAHVADVIFRDPAQRQRLESLLHPLILALQEDMISNGLRDPKVDAIILDSPLLFESNLDQRCDTVVFIEVSRPKRLRRLQKARHWDMDEFQRRESSQMPLTEKRARSRFVIHNEGSIEHLRFQVAKVFEQIRAEYSSDHNSDNALM